MKSGGKRIIRVFTAPFGKKRERRSTISSPLGAILPLCATLLSHVCGADVFAREICSAHENMSAFKRKRGGQNQVNKKGKKIKIVADDGNEPVEVEPERQNEFVLPPPVSRVSLLYSVVSPWTAEASRLWLAKLMNTSVVHS